MVFTDLERIQRIASFDRDSINFTFAEMHNKEIGDEPAAQGYPDDGNGRYIRARTYGDWYFMSIARRQRINNLDNLVMMAPISLATGFFMPYPTMVLQAAYIFGRSQYNAGYVEKEGVLNKQRMIGALLCHLSTSFLILLVGLVGFRVTRGKYNLNKSLKPSCGFNYRQ